MTRPAFPRDGSPRRGLLLALAALLFAAQAFAAGFQHARAAGAVPLDAFGDPLCITSLDHHPDEPGRQNGLPGCCLAGCVSGAASVLPPEAVTGLLTPSSFERSRFDSRTAFTFDRPRLISHNPRAPPA